MTPPPDSGAYEGEGDWDAETKAATRSKPAISAYAGLFYFVPLKWVLFMEMELRTEGN
jgi:hypothetical protein